MRRRAAICRRVIARILMPVPMRRQVAPGEVLQLHRGSPVAPLNHLREHGSRIGPGVVTGAVCKGGLGPFSWAARTVAVRLSRADKPFLPR
jgi:hypothetical protein